MRRALILVNPGIPLLAQLFRQIFEELVVDQFALQVQTLNISRQKIIFRQFLSHLTHDRYEEKGINIG
jgi:hypothetical protein